MSVSSISTAEGSINNFGISKIHAINSTSFTLNSSYTNFAVGVDGTIEYNINKYGDISGYTQYETGWINSTEESPEIDTTAHDYLSL